MEVHIWDVAAQAGEHDLKRFFRPLIKKLSIRVFHCHTARGKTFGKLTFVTADDGNYFLQIYGQNRPSLKRRGTVVQHAKLIFYNQAIYCEKSRWGADPYLLRCLKKEEQDQIETFHSLGPPVASTSFACSSLACGTYNYIKGDLVFTQELTWPVNGKLHFKEKKLVLDLENGLRVDGRYDDIALITSNNGSFPALLISFARPPQFTDVDLLQAFMNMTINIRRGNDSKNKRRRICGFSEQHRLISGSSLVYRVALSENFSNLLEVKLEGLKRARGVPAIMHHPVAVCAPHIPHHSRLAELSDTLASMSNDIPFPLAFQITKLAQNGYLPPALVLDLLPEFTALADGDNVALAVATIRKLCYEIPWAGPDTEAEKFDRDEIIDLLKDNKKLAQQEVLYTESFGGISSLNTALIHRVTITPTSILLQGPEPESNNRVLRNSQNPINLLAVQYISNVSNDVVFDDRFKSILQNGFSIAGRTFEYLGCSHSSLRAQSCWFVAPFIRNYELFSARVIIRELGDFAPIRSPAKCAARIGQAFTDTSIAVKIPDELVRLVPDIELNKRVFSDGVGTMSSSLMDRIWNHLSKKNHVMPVCLQIRYKGAKGMISLDTRLKGDVLRLRPSMVKFEGSLSDDLEICGAAYKPLPLYLNQQFTKIFEDLGVKDSWFMELQAKEVSRLRSITANPFNASTFLQRQRVGDVTFLSSLIDQISYLDLDFRNDVFLRDILEMSVLMELRTLKHKCRIPVDKGHHLHGIMDETGFLKEGQVYCCILEDGVPVVRTGKDLIITRAPALHPGDVQLVDAVDVPRNSPLKSLYNCICFSQKGARDLPSQLSGGDLDGDLYAIIWDPEVKLQKTETPADYPRLPAIDIGRPVEQSDMADFFLTFMKTDQLGMISNRHKVYADQSPDGTLSIECRKLAELASMAVDYSKTGIPANVIEMPKNILWRPDFMAPGPHVKISKLGAGGVQLGELLAPTEPTDDLDDDVSNIKYYESPKILGKLYRAIDERQVFADIKLLSLNTDDSNVMQHVWEFVIYRCQGWPVHSGHWQHLIDLCRYENCMTKIMHEYSDHPTRPISEREVFIGNILGKVGAQSRKQRELSVSMKEQYDEDATYVINCIIKDKDEYSEEALERSIACFAASLEDHDSNRKRSEEVVSFKYLAAAVCLREMERVPGLLPYV
ncbi:hypothetical protein CJF30_00009697 [Rutstroemia sp. NJR-2017a BBW]|nr:hypothetical protein CJF30_00009697 [Rutstroemia sp. NJR-2017a BBW]